MDRRPSAMADRTRARRMLFALCATQAGSVLVFLNFAGALSLIQADWQLSNTRAGAIQASGQIGYVLAVLILSPLTDYVGAGRLIVGGALWAGLGSFAFAMLARDTTSAMIFRGLTGVGVAGIYMPGVWLIAQHFPGAERGRAMGLFVASFTVGSAASIALGGAASAALGWRRAFALLSLGPLAGAVATWRMVPGPSFAPSRPTRAAHPVSELLHNRPALLTMAIYSAHTWELLGLRSWLATFLATALAYGGTGLAAATRSGATLAGLATLLGGLGTACIAALSDRVGRTRIIMAVTSLSLASMLGLGHTFSLPWALAAGMGLMAAFFANADSAVISTSLTENVPSAYLGRTLALYSFSGFTAGAIAPLLFGVVLDRTNPADLAAMGTYPTRWAWAFATLALGSVAAFAASLALHGQRNARPMEKAS